MQKNSSYMHTLFFNDYINFKYLIYFLIRTVLICRANILHGCIVITIALIFSSSNHKQQATTKKGTVCSFEKLCFTNFEISILNREYTQYGPITNGGVTACPDAVVCYKTILRVNKSDKKTEMSSLRSKIENETLWYMHTDCYLVHILFWNWILEWTQSTAAAELRRAFRSTYIKGGRAWLFEAFSSLNLNSFWIALKFNC